MPKPRHTLHLRLPPYAPPRLAWRLALHKAITAEATRCRVQYTKVDRLALTVVLYLPDKALSLHDVDNRLKDIMDALQARAGGPKQERRLRPIIPNDHQVYKVTIEKRRPPGQSHGLGHLTISRYREAQ